MNIVFLLVLAVIFAGTKISLGGGYSDTCLQRKQTNAINGAFVLLVFLRHFKQYIECGPYDKIFWVIDDYLGQLIVTTFLFYSGYGMLVSLKNKPDYIKCIPKRIFKVWLQFAAAICLFELLNLVIGKHYSLSTVLLSFTAWKAVGNSNWYIMAILVLYFLTYLGGLLTRENRPRTILLVSMGCACYIVIMILCGKGSWWYDTVFCYPAGMLVGEYEQQIKRFLRLPGRYFVLLAGCFVVFVASYMCAMNRSGMIGLAATELHGVLFVSLVILGTVKIQIGNPVLDWFGRYTFEIYILQRLAMIAFQGRGWNPYLYFGICMVMTCFMAVVFKYFTTKLKLCTPRKSNIFPEIQILP